MAIDKDREELENIIIVFLVIVAISAIIEAAFIVYAYLSADKISCNWIWCEFTTKRSQSIIEHTSECFENGVKINCSEMNFDIDNYVAQK